MLDRTIRDMGCSVILIFHISSLRKVHEQRIARRDDAGARHMWAFFQHPTCFRDTHPPLFSQQQDTVLQHHVMGAGASFLPVCSD